MQKIPKQEYTAEFKEQAVRRAQEVGVGVASRELGLVAQTLRNWAKAAAGGKLNAAGAKAARHLISQTRGSLLSSWFERG